MSLFEYLAIAFSLVFSFSVMRLVSGLPDALDPGRRYWVHVSLVGLLLLATVGIFWGFWSYRDVDWNFERFLLALANPVIVYFNACALMPEDPASVASWRAYYFTIRKRYFTGFSCWALVAAASQTVLLQMPLSHPARMVQASVFAMGVLGASSANPRVHAGIAGALLTLALLVGFVLMPRPGALAQ